MVIKNCVAYYIDVSISKCQDISTIILQLFIKMAESLINTKKMI